MFFKQIFTSKASKYLKKLRPCFGWLVFIAPFLTLLQTLLCMHSGSLRFNEVQAASVITFLHAKPWCSNLQLIHNRSMSGNEEKEHLLSTN